MISDLAKQYGQKFSRDSGKAVLGSLLGGTVPAVAGPVAASALKGLPVIGQAVGAAAMPGVAGASTYAVGKVFIQHFESGGTMLDFDPDRVRAYYAQEFEKARTGTSS